MNILLWILQSLLALHTLTGAIWKFSHTAEQTMPSLKAIPQTAWLTMSGLEIIAAIGLILPAIYKPLAIAAPLAALFVAAEMVLFTVLHFSSGNTQLGPVIYWLVVAAICAFIAFARLALRPL